MKIYRNAAILALVLAVVVGAYFLISSLTGNKTPQVTEKGFKYIDIASADKIDTVKTEYSGETLVYARTIGEDWGISFPENMKVDKFMCKSVVLNLAPLRSFKVIEEEPSDLSQYGLDNPSVITVKLKTGNEIVLNIGKRTETGENYYAKRVDEKRVVTISTAYIERLLFTLYDIKTKELFGVISDDITEITMYKGGEVAYEGFKNDFQWMMSKPLDSIIDNYLFVPVLDDIVAMNVKEFVTPKYEDLALYGLDAPRYEIMFKALGDDYHILIGKQKEGEESYYAKFNDSTEIFTIAATDLKFLEKPISQMVENHIYLVAIEEINKVELSIDKIDYRFDIVHDKVNARTGDVKVTLNGTRDVSFILDDGFQWFKKLFQELISLELEATDLSYKPSGPPEITLIYTHVIDGHVLKIEFIPKDDLYLYVVKNGLNTGILVLKSEFNLEGGVRDTLKLLN